jgi:hypothetical protein
MTLFSDAAEAARRAASAGLADAACVEREFPLPPAPAAAAH